MADDGPPLVRPIPRRPFGFSLTSATPPGSNDFDNFDDDSASSSTADFNSGNSYSSYSPHLSASGFLSSGLPSQDGTTLSRAQSVMNLTSSTLFGIYSPTTSSRDRVFPDRDEDDEDATPWGTGAQTPVRHPSVDQATYELMRGRSQALRRRRSSNRSADTVPHVPSPPTSTATTVFSLLVRGSLLFALGIGYGALVTRFQDSAGSQWATLTEDISKSSYNRVYLAFWGASGVMLGALLPWLDEVWEEAFPGDNDIEPAAIAIDLTSSDDTGAPTDWALVMRAIGAFVGIVFAIRKLAWSSTLQATGTLAMVNPLLWWLIDRSKVGFLLSTAVGFAGSIFLLGIDPGMMPTPSSPLFRIANETSRFDSDLDASSGQDHPFGGITSQETLETGVWIWSILFCSCICFGNIGRRLAWSKSAVGKGRWGGTR